MTKTDIMTKIRQTFIWRVILYIRGWHSYLHDKNFIELELPKCKESERDAKSLYPFYWFSDVIQNCGVTSIKINSHKHYWYRPTLGVMPLKYTLDEYVEQKLKSPERARIRKAAKNGFGVKQINYDDWLNDIQEINTSKEERGGRGMSDDYVHVVPRDKIVKPYNNDIYTYGCFNEEGKLVAYCMFEKITNFMITIKAIAHNDYFRFGVMNFMFAHCVDMLSARHECEYLIYGTLTPTGEGVFRFKRQAGCEVRHVMLKGERKDFKNLLDFNKSHKIYGDGALNFVRDYGK